MFGSLIAEAHGIHAASSALRHTNIELTASFYADRTVKVTSGIEKLSRRDRNMLISLTSNLSQCIISLRACANIHEGRIHTRLDRAGLELCDTIACLQELTGESQLGLLAGPDNLPPIVKSSV